MHQNYATKQQQKTIVRTLAAPSAGNARATSRPAKKSAHVSPHNKICLVLQSASEPVVRPQHARTTAKHTATRGAERSVPNVLEKLLERLDRLHAHEVGLVDQLLRHLLANHRGAQRRLLVCQKVAVARATQMQFDIFKLCPHDSPQQPTEHAQNHTQTARGELCRRNSHVADAHLLASRTARSKSAKQRTKRR